MRRRAVVSLLVTWSVVVLVFSGRGRGQSPQDSPPLGLSIDRGLVERVYGSPDSPETRMWGSIRSLNGPAERLGASGTPYLAGRLIVKFKNGASRSTRVSALETVRGTMMARPDSADFDVVAIDASEDAEAAARIVSGRNDVEYAQPAYRFHPRFKPNDPLYSRQWNLPDIDMERAWDIQPSAGSLRSPSPFSTAASRIRTRRAHIGAVRSEWTTTATW